MTTADAQQALVTGGANGIGAAICSQLASQGMSVTLCDMDRDNGQRIADQIGGHFVELDVTDGAAVARLFEWAGPFQVLVNNAGADQHAFFTRTTREDWRWLLAVNLEAAFAFTFHALPAMQAAGYGRIVNIGSEAGRLGSKGGSVYAAAKAGLVGFTRSIARENARYTITANAVLPGPVRTPMVEKAIAEFGHGLRQSMEDLTLMKRLGEADEVAALAGFLASPASSYITGEAIGVSGGMSCGAG